MDFIDAKATTSPRVASASDFFTASSGLTEKAAHEESVKPQSEKSGIGLRLPVKKKKPKEGNKSPVGQASEGSFFDTTAVGHPQSSEAPKFGSGFEFAAPRSADPESQPVQPTVSQDFFTASSGSATDVSATLSHPQVESKSGFTLRLPKAKKKTPPREREKRLSRMSEMSQTQGSRPSGSIADLPRAVRAEVDPTEASQSSPSRGKPSQMTLKPRNFGMVSVGAKSDETVAGADLDAAATKIQAIFRGKTARQLVKTKLDAIAAIGRVKLHGQSKDGSPLETSEGEDHARESARNAIPLNTFFEVSQAIQTEHTTGNLSEEQAASKIQALYRGKMARRHVSNQHDAATRIQALWRGRQVRAKATLISVAQVGMLRIKAMRHGHSPSSPSPSPALQEAQKTFLETPRQSPRTQGESLRAAVRLQAVFRGNQVRRLLEAQRQAATKIQAKFRGRKGRLFAMDLATVVNLRVKVHNFHKSAAGASKVMVDNSFFDAGGIVSEPLPQEKAAVTIQNFYRRRRGDTRISRNSGIADVVSSVGPAAVGAVRRSLVAAGFAVVGAGNAQIAQLFHRASATFDEALSAVGSAGDAAAQRASVALGESLLQMVVDTSSPPESPKMKSHGKDEEPPGQHDEDGSDSESDEPKDSKLEDEPKHWTAGDGDSESKPRSKKAAAREFIRCIDQSCAKLQGWLQRRKERPPAAPLRLDLVPLAPLAAPVVKLGEEKDKALQMLPSEMPMMGGRLEKCEVAPRFYPGDACRDCGLSGRSFKSISAELEFSLWGFCEACQDKLFLLQTAESETAGVSLIAPGYPFAALSPYHTVPVVYPDDTPWISPFHLFLAHQFPEHDCQKFVHSAGLGSSVRSLTALLDQDLLRNRLNRVREDWPHGWAVKAMRHAIFLAVEQHPRLAALLLATGTSRLICLSENFLWGMEQQDNAFRGENLIGKILEEKRDLLT